MAIVVRVWDANRSGIQQMDIEEYLAGVLPREMSPGWPTEALKAQAVVARSYAANKGTDFRAVLERDERDQVYGNERYPDTTDAVRATAGEVLTRGGHPVMAFFFGHCDGHTRAPADVGWNEAMMQDGPVFRPVPCRCGFTDLYGHGLGMCQEGARAMANAGASYRDILTHYYRDVAIERLPGSEPGPGGPGVDRH